ncbi:MAG TPA: hypothetical protein PKE63_09195, partial [Lacibacter sp.]|nr:hypothetical protein [Lacibacter sp.]
ATGRGSAIGGLQILDFGFSDSVPPPRFVSLRTTCLELLFIYYFLQPGRGAPSGRQILTIYTSVHFHITTCTFPVFGSRHQGMQPLAGKRVKS